ncbi:hypothetical protein DICPUDRAFT_80047 [Dictyostelium purpureum]|uniref:OB domain-containing protein n=1 Tax=Dictyostelium purpureum TaxID=5786 RepID=F0ZPD2_DICPU|nr:uncharacterized protein DICPUDRAFT_80047 [Dictyostelium purpureum]EGC34181.1 hypothetical protein DICPUDRAFT_80047 [Dictyostelium purpureum]|eukprot:XP_003289285.1 hypothetical protein DICPUDRAFT_80047 [Dictyostelium purpureum]
MNNNNYNSINGNNNNVNKNSNTNNNINNIANNSNNAVHHNNNNNNNNNNNSIAKPFYNNHFYLNENNENIYPTKQKCYFKLFISDIYRLKYVTTSKRFLFQQRIPTKYIEIFGHIVSFQKKKKFGLMTIEMTLDDGTGSVECEYFLIDTPDPKFSTNQNPIRKLTYFF